MQETITLWPIAHIENGFAEKFGVPRQSGLVRELRAEIIFEEPYRVAEALAGLEEFSHIWLIWEFSGTRRADWSPTVRPPRLGGNQRRGVFATRSPYRPNPLGLSCVELLGIEYGTPRGPILRVGGADLVNGTPIFDIKPYIPYADSRPQAAGSFAERHKDDRLDTEIPEECLWKIPPQDREAVRGILAQDPRPAYQDDEERVYGLTYGRRNIRFRVQNGRAVVCGVEEIP